MTTLHRENPAIVLPTKGVGPPLWAKKEAGSPKLNNQTTQKNTGSTLKPSNNDDAFHNKEAETEVYMHIISVVYNLGIHGKNLRRQFLLELERLPSTREKRFIMSTLYGSRHGNEEQQRQDIEERW
jgi:hypothetical protein